MTTPTPTQIEAFRTIEDKAQRALDALDENVATIHACRDIVTICDRELTAAAQVGEPITTAEMYDNRVNEIVAARQKEIETTTIERCAQACLCIECAEAIRKLRDK